jgi:hypothetical protein
MEPIAYVYDHGVHCPDCAHAAFGRCDASGEVACGCTHPVGGPDDPWHPVEDADGNPVGAVFPLDLTVGEGPALERCATCDAVLWDDLSP